PDRSRAVWRIRTLAKFRAQKRRKPPEPKLQRPSLVGATGVEPATTCTPSKCATRLRYAPSRYKRARVFRTRAEGCQRDPRCGLFSAVRDRRRRGRLAAVLRLAALVEAVEHVLQHLAGAEGEHAPRGDLDLLA